MPIPTESEEQQQLFLWAQWMEGQHPELALLHHIPNEGKRSKATGGRLVAEGLRKGVPDICLPVPNAIYHGLYIELKRINGRASEDQKRWISALNNQGYRAAICFGWDEAAKVIMSYLNIKGGPHHVEE
ncbi:VRR-NUC domain-containing protein [Anaerotruncus sp. AF02-27]|nr:VRR-NUC domain-containing protein [Anaerotruncus sp. AF02-27]